ncbi:MAG: hypothetical protein ACLF0P_11905 [Thermoanaerobaculia bacterium]
MSAPARPGVSGRSVAFDPTPEIFATDAAGAFAFLLQAGGESYVETGAYDECRLVFSVWHPSEKRSIDLDRAYVEVRARFDPEHEEHWTRIAEIEPVVPPYGSESFDGWIVLPVLGDVTAFALHGAGFEARSRIQIRGSAYLVP